MKKTLLTSALLSVVISAFAVMADPTPFEYTLPDGSKVMAIMHGDEFHSYITTLDGTILQGSKEETLVETTMRKVAQSNIRRVGGDFPKKGSPRSLAILINFKNEPMQHSREEFENLLNQSGYSVNGSTGSCRDYYIASSDSLFQPYFDVYGPYTVSKTSAQYTNAEPKYGTSALIEAIRIAESEGLDFSKYDMDNDGVVDNIFFYYAGHNQAEGGGTSTIWPHQSTLSYRGIYVSGKQVASYACTSELRGAGGSTICNIGTFCHEFGHVLGLPDFYDTEHDNAYTIGAWDLMCSGSYNNESRTPPAFTAYERWFMGWITPTQITEAGNYILRPLNTSGEAYLLANNPSNMNVKNPNPNEFFLLEYRTASGWDAPRGSLPGYGMLVWHIDYNANAWNSNTPNNSTPLRYHMEEANGRDAGAPYPGTSNVTKWIPTLHNGTQMEPVMRISEHTGSHVSFIYKSSGDKTIETYPASIDLTTTMTDGNKMYEWQAKQLRIKGEHLEPGDNLYIKSEGRFYIADDSTATSKYNSSLWTQALTISNAVNADSILDTVIYVCFRPTKKSCNVASNMIEISTSETMASVALTGSAERPNYIVTPQGIETIDSTATSFRIKWDPQPDAVYYYMMVYRVEEGQSEYMQSFENFNKTSGIEEANWQSNTHSTTTAAKAHGQRAMYFNQNDIEMITEEYQSDITEISYWVSAFSADRDSVGAITIEGRANGSAWQHVNTQLIKANTKNKYFTIEIDTKLAYRQFRITYQDFGESGVAFDAFTALASQNIIYRYKAHELQIPAFDDPDLCIQMIDQLETGKEYYYQLQATDYDNGCEEHLSEWSAPRKVTTVANSGSDLDLRIRYENGTFVVYPDDADGKKAIYLFNELGQLIWKYNVGEMEYFIVIPNELLQSGHSYIVKYADRNKIHRKDKRAKIAL